MKVDFGQSLASAFAITSETRAEAWRVSIAQAPTLGAVGALEDRLHRRIALLRDREQSCDVEREALALCALRRDEIAAAAAMRPGATGNDQDAPSAQGVHDEH